ISCSPSPPSPGGAMRYGEDTACHPPSGTLRRSAPCSRCSSRPISVVPPSSARLISSIMPTTRVAASIPPRRSPNARATPRICSRQSPPRKRQCARYRRPRHPAPPCETAPNHVRQNEPGLRGRHAAVKRPIRALSVSRRRLVLLLSSKEQEFFALLFFSPRTVSSYASRGAIVFSLLFTMGLGVHPWSETRN